MHISIEHHGNQFNVALASQQGKDAFLIIKGCRIVNGSKGEFVSFPATKNESTGKWWNHVYANEKFAATVLELAKVSQPQQYSATGARSRDEDMDNDFPF